eukprot:6460593-Amphidinium_carterae.1
MRKRSLQHASKWETSAAGAWFTMDRLSRHFGTGDSLCVLCGEDRDTMHHRLLRCPAVQATRDNAGLSAEDLVRAEALHRHELECGVHHMTDSQCFWAGSGAKLIQIVPATFVQAALRQRREVLPALVQ